MLASRTEPLLFVLDDVQWADPSELQLLRHLLSHPDRSPLLVVATTRPEGLDPTHPLATVIASADAHHLVDFVVLEGLSQPEVEALAGHLARSPQGRAQRVWERTGGNPFLVWALLGGAGGEEPLPGSARDAIARQVAALGPTVFQVLTGAAVAGEAFRGEVVAAALGGERPNYLAALERAVGAGLVVEDKDRAGHYRFRHAIVRDALSGAITPTRRVDLHLRMAHALQATADPQALPEVARHLHAALPAGDAGAARRAALRAAVQAMERFAYEVAAFCADMALDAIDAGGGDESDRAEARQLRGDAHLKAGDLEQAASDFQASLAVARAGRDQRRCAEAVLGWAASSAVWGRHPQLRAALEELLASDIDDPGLRAQLKAKLAQVLYYEGAPERRAELSRGALEDARASGRSDTVASVLVATHAALWGPQDLDARTAVAQEIVSVARSSSRLELEASGLAWLAADLLEAGDLQGADEAMARHAALAERLHQRLLLRDVELWKGMRGNG